MSDLRATALPAGDRREAMSLLGEPVCVDSFGSVGTCRPRDPAGHHASPLRRLAQLAHACWSLHPTTTMPNGVVEIGVNSRKIRADPNLVFSDVNRGKRLRYVGSMSELHRVSESACIKICSRTRNKIVPLSADTRTVVVLVELKNSPLYMMIYELTPQTEKKKVVVSSRRYDGSTSWFP